MALLELLPRVAYQTLRIGRYTVTLDVIVDVIVDVTLDIKTNEELATGIMSTLSIPVRSNYQYKKSL